jgi:hypothetical protein
MRLRTVVVIDALILLALAAAVWSKPVPEPIDGLLSFPAETHLISGTVTSVNESDLALDVLKNQKPDVVHFLIDEHTAVEGKLAAGVQAAVNYRIEGDKMIATRVVVTQSPGFAAN